jgi:hypothetical protein
MSAPDMRGHNQPPADAEFADLRERLTRDHKPLVERFYAIELGINAVPDEIADAETAGRVTDFIGQARALVESCKIDHRREKRPFLDGGKVIDDFFLRRNDKLTRAIEPVIARLKRYRDAVEAKERQRQAEEREHAEIVRQRAQAEADARLAEALRLAGENDRAGAAVAFEASADAEREAQQAQAVIDAPPARAVVRGDYGSAAYSKSRWTFEIVDVTIVPLGYLSPDPALLQLALDHALAEASAAGRDTPEIEIPGIRFFLEESLVVRRGGAR